MDAPIPEYSVLPYFVGMFSILYLIGYKYAFRNWSPEHRPLASSCFISLNHGTPAVLLALAAILAQPVREFASQNTNFQNCVLEFSMAYFIADLSCLVFLRRDYLFIAHHLATLFVFFTCRYQVSRSALELLVLLVCAEVTSPFQNIWTLAGMLKAESPLAAKFHKEMSLPFYVFYTVMRGLAGPAFVYKMGAYYLSGKAAGVVPMWVSTSWIVLITIAMVVSIIWVSNLWLELLREASLRRRIF